MTDIADSKVAMQDKIVELNEQLAYHDAPDQAFLDLQAANARLLMQIRELTRRNSLILGRMKSAESELKKLRKKTGIEQ